ncbi:MAG: hypothetical protein A3F41_07285 [Coxiella sp. RIFCSPHIGHO2_12_FULL_44_14]|nr:MAG: hypothetical protein A3F41_07285 [Coxiella sp. RIFCSPHIGHO2_12_FULL_44_14]
MARGAWVLLKKIKSRGLFWFFARLLTESHRPVSKSIKIGKPFIQLFYWMCVRPLNQLRWVRLKSQVLSKDRLYLFYDLEVSPVTYDFAWALAIADYERRRLGLSGVHVIFVPGKNHGLREEDPEYEEKVDWFARYWRRHAILYSLSELLPHCTGVTFYSSRDEACLLCEQVRPHVFPKQYSVLFPVAHSSYQALTEALSLMFLQPTQQARRYIEQWLSSSAVKGRKVVTITLRQSSYMPARNSDIHAWAHFASRLDPQRYFVVFVPDTEKALEPTPSELTPFVYFTEPCWNVGLRAALYDASFINLGVNNGPMILCWLNEQCRYITFKMKAAGVPQTTDAAFRTHGFEIGKSLPFAKPYQKWVWEDDREDVIQKEFHNLCNLIQNSLS